MLYARAVPFTDFGSGTDTQGGDSAHHSDPSSSEERGDKPYAAFFASFAYATSAVSMPLLAFAALYFRAKRLGQHDTSADGGSHSDDDDTRQLMSVTPETSGSDFGEEPDRTTGGIRTSDQTLLRDADGDTDTAVRVELMTADA